MSHHPADQLCRLIWGSYDPYATFCAKRFRPDLQGWNSSHVYLREAAALVDTKIGCGGNISRYFPGELGALAARALL